MSTTQLIPVWFVIVSATAIGKDSPVNMQNEIGNNPQTTSHGSGAPNRLSHEKSPYLLQHAFNPVDWYPWGDEAFAKAKKEDKPIFLSIGYSTCYWCHVMEREVFEDTAIARLMNEKLVCIKVDREERPDIDRVYMTAVQAISGSGGWPMSVFMTPDRKPFFGGTYIPPKAQYGRPGFPDLVDRVDELWRHDRKKLLESSEQILAMLQSSADPGATTTVTDSVLHAAYRQILQSYDSAYGGFGGGPKFPRPATFNFLLRYYARTGEDSALRMTLTTLRAMANGGMHDQIGGGFHRYSVDGQWRVPHFEKMLYDQAQLATAYLEAYQISHDPFFAAVARDVLDFVLKAFKDPQGGFTSALDAESAFDASRPDKKEEGEFYLWKKAQIEEVLERHDAAIFNYRFGVEDSGNALHDPMSVFIGKNILYVAHSIEECAKEFHATAGNITTILDGARKKLMAERERRPHPHLDDKIITAWNGLMISALAKGYQILGDRKYIDAAEHAAEFIAANLYDGQRHTLSRRYRDGDARFAGGLQDYAFHVMGLLDLYEASFNIRWLEQAIALTTKQVELFYDSSAGGFFDVTGEDPTILVKTKEDYDGAEPSGNSVAALNLLRLASITDNKAWHDAGEKTVAAFGARLQRYPETLVQMLVAVDWHLSIPKEVIIAGASDDSDTRSLLKEVHARFLPHMILLMIDGDPVRKKISAYLPFTEGMKKIDGRATIYICENYACQLPTSDPATAARLLNTGTAKK